MSRPSLVFACALVPLAALAGCGADGPTAPGSIPVSELSAAPTTVVVAGKTLTLGSELWRDFQPISPPDGKPLIGALQVTASDGSAVPEGVRADAVWLVMGTEVWLGTPREERPRTETAPVYELVARDGPKWGPGVNVDVVIRLRDGTNRDVLLRAANQPIRGTF